MNCWNILSYTSHILSQEGPFFRYISLKIVINHVKNIYSILGTVGFKGKRKGSIWIAFIKPIKINIK